MISGIMCKDVISNATGRMGWVDPLDAFRVFDRHDIGQIHCNRLAVTPHQHTLQLLVLHGIDLLVRHVRRDVDKVARPGFGRELESLAPSHARLALDHVDDALEVAVVVGTRFGVGVDLDGAGPEFLRPDSSHVHRGRPVHARRLCRVGVEVVAWNDPDAAFAPGVGRLVLR